MAFAEIRFPDNISPGAIGGPGFKTNIIASSSGEEQRASLWAIGRHRWNVAHELKTNAQRDDLLNFFMARKGRIDGFRFKDWVDYKIAPPTLTVSLTATTFQTVKRYVSGGTEVIRTITKPVLGTMRIFENDGGDIGDEILTGWSVCITSGIITFAVAPGFIPFIVCEFDVPARFDTDDMAFNQKGAVHGGWDGIPVVEINHTSNVCAYATDADTGPYDDGTTGGTGGETNGNPGGLPVYPNTGGSFNQTPTAPCCCCCCCWLPRK